MHHQFEIAAEVEKTWPAFLDMPRIAPCMPGAEVTEVIDERNVKGAATVKVGPLSLRFTGQAEIGQVDDSGRSAVMTATGSDAKGRGNADAEIRFSLSEATDRRTLVEVDTTLNLTGTVAQFGRAAGLLDEIANQLIAGFVECLEAELAPGGPDPQDAEQEGLPSSTGTPAVQPVSGLRLFFRALWATIKKWLRRS